MAFWNINTSPIRQSTVYQLKALLLRIPFHLAFGTQCGGFARTHGRRSWTCIHYWLNKYNIYIYNMCIKYTIYITYIYIYIHTYMLIYIYMFAASLMFSFAWMDTMATYESWSCKTGTCTNCIVILKKKLYTQKLIKSQLIILTFHPWQLTHNFHISQTSQDFRVGFFASHCTALMVADAILIRQESLRPMHTSWSQDAWWPIVSW